MSERKQTRVLRVCPVILAFLILSVSPCRMPAFQAGNTATTSGGNLQGKVVLDNDGSAVAGVTVVAYKTVVAATAIGSSGTAVTAKDGSFTISGLTSGQFRVCVRDSTGTLVDPCQWGDSPKPVALSAGLVIRVKKVSTVSVRINDTGQYLIAKSATAPKPHVLVGAYDAQGLFHPAMQTAQDATGVSYQLTISVDTPVRLSLFSAQVKLTDSQNVAIPAQGYATTFIQPSSQTTQKSFVFNAVGHN